MQASAAASTSAGSIYYLWERRSVQCDFFRFLQLSVSTGHRGNAGGCSVSVATVEDHRGARRFTCEDMDAVRTTIRAEYRVPRAIP